MRGSLKIFTWFGIPVFVHWSFGLIFLYILGHAYSNGLSPVDTAWMSGMFMAIFGCVLLHEYGHALAARRYGVRTRDIVLMPIGGMARLERMPEKPRQEFVVAIAGPMVNVVIFILTAAAIAALSQPEHMEALRTAVMSASTGNSFLDTCIALFKIFQEALRVAFFGAPTSPPSENTAGIEIPKLLQYSINFAISNLILVVFNMIPAFPMDGGRVLRALLSMRIGRAKATRIASWIGQGFAVLFAAWGIYSGNIMLSVLGLFVIYAARSENDMVQTESVLGRFKVSDLMRPEFTRMQSNDWMMNAIETLQHGLERHFLVFDLYGQLVGLLEESDILAAQRKPDVTAAVSKYMQKTEAVTLDESLLRVHHLIRQRGYGLVAVMDADQQLVGVIDEAGLSYFLKNRG